MIICTVEAVQNFHGSGSPELGFVIRQYKEKVFSLKILHSLQSEMRSKFIQ